MGNIPNGYGENMPDEVTIRLHYNVNGQLGYCSGPSAQVLEGSNTLARIATVYSEMTFQSVCVSRDATNSERFNTLSSEERSFLYMDVGRWGGRRGESGLAGGSVHREFGVVCGCHAVLPGFCRRANKAFFRLTHYQKRASREIGCTSGSEVKCLPSAACRQPLCGTLLGL